MGDVFTAGLRASALCQTVQGRQESEPYIVTDEFLLGLADDCFAEASSSAPVRGEHVGDGFRRGEHVDGLLSRSARPSMSASAFQAGPTESPFPAHSAQRVWQLERENANLKRQLWLVLRQQRDSLRVQYEADVLISRLESTCGHLQVQVIEAAREGRRLAKVNSILREGLCESI